MGSTTERFKPGKRRHQIELGRDAENEGAEKKVDSENIHSRSPMPVSTPIAHCAASTDTEELDDTARPRCVSCGRGGRPWRVDQIIAEPA
jgi:hypothetical protein